MADAPKKKRVQGPRTPKPIFAIVTYTNEDGSLVQMDANRLSIAFERDSTKLLEALLPGGGGIGQASAVVRVQLPAPQPRKQATQAEAAPAA